MNDLFVASGRWCSIGGARNDNDQQPTTHHPHNLNFAVLQFPASNCDQDAIHALRDVLGQSARYVWHKDTSLGDADAVVVPGGFSYGDYLRCGAIARFSPVMQAVQQFAANGGFVLGICNGFQVLCEAGLLPGALVRNRSLQFRCEHIYLKTLTNGSLGNVAGICNERRNVAGMMPHPERACEAMLGSADGRLIFQSLIHTLQSRTV